MPGWLSWPAKLLRIPGPIRALLGWAGLVAVVVSAIVYSDTTTFPGVAAALPVLATAAVVAAGPTLRTGPAALLGWGPLQWIGQRSYSIYLWHWPALVLVAAQLGPLSAWQRLAVVLASVGVAAVTYTLPREPRPALPLAGGQGPARPGAGRQPRRHRRGDRAGGRGRHALAGGQRHGRGASGGRERVRRAARPTATATPAEHRRRGDPDDRGGRDRTGRVLRRRAERRPPAPHRPRWRRRAAPHDHRATDDRGTDDHAARSRAAGRGQRRPAGPERADQGRAGQPPAVAARRPLGPPRHLPRRVPPRRRRHQARVVRVRRSGVAHHRRAVRRLARRAVVPGLRRRRPGAALAPPGAHQEGVPDRRHLGVQPDGEPGADRVRGVAGQRRGPARGRAARRSS